MPRLKVFPTLAQSIAGFHQGKTHFVVASGQGGDMRYIGAGETALEMVDPRIHFRVDSTKIVIADALLLEGSNQAPMNQIGSFRLHSRFVRSAKQIDRGVSHDG